MTKRHHVLKLALLLLLASCLIALWVERTGRESEDASSGGRELRLPESIVAKLKSKEEANAGFNCQGNPQLFSSHYFDLEKEGLLLLLGIPDYLCATNTFLPVLVTPDGRWQSGDFLPGEPAIMVRGAARNLWLTTQWMIEGTYPALYRSSDGLGWTPIPLPENRNVDCCFEWIRQICFVEDVLRLKFTNNDQTTVRYWAADMANSREGQNVWRRLEPETSPGGQSCDSTVLGPGKWLRSSSAAAREVIFERREGRNVLRVIVPKFLSTR